MSARLPLLLAIFLAMPGRAADDPTRRTFDPDPPRLSLSLDGNYWPIVVAVLADLRLPTGNAQAFMSDGIAAVPSLIVTRAFGRVRLDGQVGYFIRGQGQYAQLVVHDGFVYALGASVDLPKV